jgi:hypothetical protein
MARHWHTVVVLTGQGDGVLQLCHSRAWLPREESRIPGLAPVTPGSDRATPD